MLDLSPIAQEYMRNQWQELVLASGGNASQALEIWEVIAAHYSESGRHYHNLSHIYALLHHANHLKTDIKYAAVVSFSIWFHDIIYDTRASDNEEQSAAFASRALSELSLPESTIHAVMQCILATKKHELLPGVPDMAIFLDMDLAILGAPPEIYAQYSQAIQDECAWVPAEAFRQERSKVLKKFEQRPQLYFTSSMRDRFERQARANLAEEIKRLASF